MEIWRQAPGSTSCAQPYQLFGYHSTGLRGTGYDASGGVLDCPAVRWRDTDGDADLDEELHYLQDFRGDVGALAHPKYGVLERVRYGPTGRPEAFPAADIDFDGDVDGGDAEEMDKAVSGFADSAAHYDPRADLDKDGDVDEDDENLFLMSYDQFDGLSGNWKLSQGTGLVASEEAWKGGLDNRFGWRGYWYDSHLQKYHVRNRVHDPREGRWMQTDPLGFDAGDPDLYRYCFGEYSTGYDPMGLWFEAFGQRLTNRGAFGQAVGTALAVVGGALEGGFNGYKAVVTGAAKAVVEMISVGLDIQGNMLELGAFAVGIDFRYRNISHLMQSMEQGGTWGEMFAQGGENAWEATKSMGTLGVYDIYQGIEQFSCDGDVDALGDRMGGVIVNNMSIVAGEALGKGSAPAGGEEAAGLRQVPQDVKVSGRPAPKRLSLKRAISKDPLQNALKDKIVAEAQRQGATDIRVNQWQVDINEQLVGMNKPDIQYTLNGERIYVEIDGATSPRGGPHATRILANDPNGTVYLVQMP